jgi:hypothetical protein
MLKKIVMGAASLLFFTLPVLAQETASLDQRIAFTRDHALYVLESGSTEPTLIYEDPQQVQSYHAAWSPDGTKLAYMVESSPDVTAPDILRVWDGSDSVDVVAALKPVGLPLAWTPAGDILYFVSTDNVGPQREDGTNSLIAAYTVAPTADATPTLLSDQLPFAYLCGGFYGDPMSAAVGAEQSDVNVVSQYLSNDEIFYSDNCAGSSLTRFVVNLDAVSSVPRFTDNPTISPSYYLANFNYESQEDGARERFIEVINMEDMQPSPVDTTAKPSAIAWGTDNRLYYSTQTQVGDLVTGAAPAQLSKYNDVFSVFTENGVIDTFPVNAAAIYRLEEDGTSTPLVTWLYVYDIPRMQVVDDTLYFSTVANGEDWFEGVLNGTITADSPDNHLAVTLYALDLSTPGSLPVIVQENAGQFTVAGQ